MLILPWLASHKVLPATSRPQWREISTPEGKLADITPALKKTKPTNLKQPSLEPKSPGLIAAAGQIIRN